MAPQRRQGNLQDMYTTIAPRIRDQPAAYGPHEVEGDAYPAAGVLDDLTGVQERDIPRILARYAALRCWLLRDARADPGLVRHAARTARAYLAVLPDGRERAALEQLVSVYPDLDAARDAGQAAAVADHPEGAFALLRAGYLAARGRSDLAMAARFADDIAGLLRARSMDGPELWARRAERLRRSADGPG